MVNIMESVKQQTKILEKRRSYFCWGGTSCITYPGWRATGLCFEGKAADCFKLLELSDFKDDRTLQVLSNVEKAFQESTSISSIEMSMVRDCTSGTHKMLSKVCFDKTIVKNLSNLLTEPKIVIKGTFSSGSLPFSTPAMRLNVCETVENFEGASAIVDELKARTAAIHYGVDTTVFLEWTDLKMSIVKEPCAVLEMLFSEKLLADCCIVTYNEVEVSCHRCILAANSDVIRTMLTNGMQESQTNRIEMTDASEEVVNLLVEFLYGRAINTKEMKEEVAFDLLCVAHKYNIKPLEELMVVTLFNMPNDSLSINTVLNAYFYTNKIKDFHVLSEKMLNILKGSPSKLLASSVFQDLKKNTPNEAIELTVKLLELVIGERSSAALPAID